MPLPVKYITHRDEPLPHAAEIAAIDAQAREGVETHLYLTDYRSLYVGNLGEVTADDVRAEEGEAEHAPPYYRGMEADSGSACGTCGGWWRTTRRG